MGSSRVLYRIEVAHGSGIGVYRVIRLVFVFRLQGFRVVQGSGFRCCKVVCYVKLLQGPLGLWTGA